MRYLPGNNTNMNDVTKRANRHLKKQNKSAYEVYHHERDQNRKCNLQVISGPVLLLGTNTVGSKDF